MRYRLISLIALLLCVLMSAGCGSTPITSHPTPTPGIGTVTATISGLGALQDQFAAYAVAADDTAVWVLNSEAGKLLRIDPNTNTLVATVQVGIGQTGGLALGLGAVWVASLDDGTLLRIDPATNQIAATIQVAPQSDHIAVTVSTDAVWVTDYDDNQVFKVDPKTNRVVANLTNHAGPTDVEYGAGSLWICDRDDTGNNLIRLDPETLKVQAQFPTNSSPCAVIIPLAHDVWTLNFDSGQGATVQLVRIDPTTNTSSAQIPVPDMYPNIAADEQGVWLFNPDMGLFRLDPQTNRIAGKLAITGGAGVGIGAGSVWFAKHDGTLLRITPAQGS